VRPKHWTNRVTLAALGIAAFWVVSTTGNQQNQTATGRTATEGRAPRNPAEYDEMFNRIKNWGRWGPDDQRGAANLITDTKRKQAVALVKLGTSISLSHNYLKDKAPDNPSPFEHVMNRGLQSDTYRVSYHGYAHSHMDGLCHMLYQDKTYNGYSRADALTDNGCVKLGIENLKNGVITRGVLIDIPRLKGVPYLEPSTPVYIEDIEAWEKKAGVKVGSGDAVILYTGRWARREKLGPWPLMTNSAGFHASVAPWAKARDIAFIGSDAVLDVYPELVQDANGRDQANAFHILMIAALGVDIFDNLDLEALAQTAARLNRWEFMLTVAPLVVTGGTGSPANPIATF
jgi:kynurenine formamidase